jgi:methylated-DNA-[protein]-cysteine S-methyltransferase
MYHRPPTIRQDHDRGNFVRPAGQNGVVIAHDSEIRNGAVTLDDPALGGTVTPGSVLRALDWAVIDAPIGPVSVGCSKVGVASVRFGPPPAGAAPSAFDPAGAAPSTSDPAGAAPRAPDPADVTPSASHPAGAAPSTSDPVSAALRAPDRTGGLLGIACAQLDNYFNGKGTIFDIALDWGNCSGSQRAVLSLLAETVEFGQTVTYGALARRLSLRDGRPDIGARAIGSIMGSNPIPIIVPCHRVVAADGLGGFSGGCGIELKRWLLTFEGALPEMLDFGEPQRPSLLTAHRRTLR